MSESIIFDVFGKKMRTIIFKLLEDPPPGHEDVSNAPNPISQTVNDTVEKQLHVTISHKTVHVVFIIILLYVAIVYGSKNDRLAPRPIKSSCI